VPWTKPAIFLMTPTSLSPSEQFLGGGFAAATADGAFHDKQKCKRKNAATLVTPSGGEVLAEEWCGNKRKRNSTDRQLLTIRRSERGPRVGPDFCHSMQVSATPARLKGPLGG